MPSLKQRLGAAVYDAVMKWPEETGLQQWRRRLLERARGDVLEIGIGTGANIDLYPAEIGDLVGVDPDPAMVDRIDSDEFSGGGQFRLVQGVAGDLPVDDDAIDTVVSTLVLCSVPDQREALAEIARVLKPDGRLLFLEHVASTDDRLRTWQDRLDGVWHWCNGDCHMNRRTGPAIEEAGFELDDCIREPMPSTPSLLRPSIRGQALPPDR